MRINEICDKNQCVIQTGYRRGYKAGQIDPKLAQAADNRDTEIDNWEMNLSDKDYDTYDRARMKAYDAKDGGSVYRSYLAGKQHLNKSNRPAMVKR